MDHVAVHGLQAVLFLWINLTGLAAPKEKGGGPKTASLCMRPGFGATVGE